LDSARSFHISKPLLTVLICTIAARISLVLVNVHPQVAAIAHRLDVAINDTLDALARVAVTRTSDSIKMRDREHDLTASPDSRLAIAFDTSAWTGVRSV
jgi:hypothetical protein